MIDKIYDPQYETNIPHFNRKVVEQWISDNNIEKVKHWLENGRPHARLANEAIYYCINQDNSTIIDLVYNSNWIQKEKVLNNVLNKCVIGVLPEEFDKDYFPEIREWAVLKTFLEVKNESFKEKTIKELIYLISKTKSFYDAYKYGVDYSIKSVSEEISLFSRYLHSNLEKLDKLYKNIEKDTDISVLKKTDESLYYLRCILFLIKNKASVDDQIFRTLTQYNNKEKFDFVLPFFKEILYLEHINIYDHRMLGLFVTELAIWKHCNFISEDNFTLMLKLFIRSGLKEKFSIKRKEVKDDYHNKGVLFNYFKTRYGVVGAIEIGKAYRNNMRPNQIIFYKNYSFQDGEDSEKVVIDIKEYIFIDHNEVSNNPNDVTIEDVKNSIDKYEKIKHE